MVIIFIGVSVAAVVSIVTFAMVTAWARGFFRQSIQGNDRHEDEIAAEAIIRSINNNENHKPFILYLRPFDLDAALTLDWFGDESRIVSPLRASSFDDMLMAEFDDEFMLVALGRPGEYFGAARIPSSDEQWWQTATKLMDRANAIIVIPCLASDVRPGIYTGMHREIAFLLANPNLSAKCVFVMPPSGQLFELSENEWQIVVNFFVAHKAWAPPHEHQGGMWNTQGNFVPVFESKCSVDIPYAIAALSGNDYLRFIVLDDSRDVIDIKNFEEEVDCESSLILAISYSRWMNQVGIRFGLADEIEQKLKSLFATRTKDGSIIINHPASVINASMIIAGNAYEAGCFDKAKHYAHQAVEMNKGIPEEYRQLVYEQHIEYCTSLLAELSRES